MKKYSFAVLFALLLIFVLSPAAFADNITIYDAPGAITAGAELNHLVASVPAGSSVKGSSIGGSTDADWIRVEISPAGDTGDNVYLRGSTLIAGKYNYFVNIESPEGGSNSISCTVSVNPAVPLVSMNSSPVECYPGDNVQLSVSGSVNDGGSLSYQWYSNSTNSNYGGIPLEDGTSGSVIVNTNIEGITYYYCMVTNTNNGMSSVSVSSPCSVSVKNAEIASISIANLPLVTNYKLGDSLNAAGLQINLNFADGSSKIISEGFSLYPIVLDEAGIQTITVSYGDKNCSYNVNVEEENEVINGIGVLSMPDKTEYLPGEELDIAGLSIRVYTNSGQRDVSDGLEVSPRVLEKTGDQVITVSYGGKTCTFTVKVKAEEKVISLSVLSKPQKLNYILGDELDTKGLSLRQTMNTGEKITVTDGFTCSPAKFTKTGPQTVTVTYGEFTCSFNVNVTEKKTESSPVSGENPENPQKPQAEPEATPHISHHEPHKTGSHTVLVVIMIIAVLALVGLGIYACIMNQRGEDNFVERIKDFLDSIKKDR